jgi:hypothetical protein
MRDLFGPLLFRSLALDPAWINCKDGSVVRMAQAIYDDQAFERLPILADTLERAGCNNEDILSHCRASGPHFKGCWVLDLILEKQ